MKQAAAPPLELGRLGVLWDAGLGAAYDAYLAGRIAAAYEREPVAMAAALVETALRVQELGNGAAEAQALLLGDLCLSRASRLLVDHGDQRLQTAVSRAVEQSAAAAAAGGEQPPLRETLALAIEGRA